MSRNDEEGTSRRVEKKVSMACDRCRSAKLKCDGRQPCGKCTNRGLACVFGRTDGRRRGDLKRKLDELQGDSELLQDLLETLRDVDDVQVQQIVSLIRSNPPLDEVKTCIKQALIDFRVRQRQPSPELRLVQGRLDAQNESEVERLVTPSSTKTVVRQSSKLEIARLIDTPLVIVPAQPWTDVSMDDALVSHILSCWITWEKPFYNWIDMDPCLRDMQAGEAGAQYCSPFLFNALMAYGCSFAQYAETKAFKGAPSSLLNSFLSKAKSLIPPKDDEENLLTTAQGLMSLSMAESIVGKDASAFERYGLRAGRLCERLQMHNEELEQSTDHCDMVLLRANRVCCWGVFDQICLTSWIYRQPSPMSPPNSVDKLLQVIEGEPTWTPYPNQGSGKPSDELQLLHQRSKLTLIIMDLANYFARYKRATSISDTNALTSEPFQLLDRLLRWRSSSPMFLSTTVEPSAPLLVHRAYYFSVVITLCSTELVDSPSQEEWSRQASPQMWAATMELVDIFRKHDQLYGNTVACVYLVHPLSVAINVLLERNEMGTYDSEITHLCIFLRAMSRRFPFAFAVLRMLQGAARESKKNLPQETEKLFDDFVSSEWIDRQLAELDSFYPVDSVNVVSKLPTPQNMSEFIALLDQLGVNDVR